MPHVLIVLAIIVRFMPHPFGVTPIGGIGLFAGAYCDRRIAWLVPLAALFVGDVVTGFYDPVVMLFVYLGFATGPIIGRWLLFRKRTVLRFGGAVFSANVVFFILSNFGMWLSGAFPYTFSGLAECYIRATPYFWTTLLGDLVYGGIMFGSYEGIRYYMSHRGNASRA